MLIVGNLKDNQFCRKTLPLTSSVLSSSEWDMLAAQTSTLRHAQRAYFMGGNTLALEFRLKQLKRLKQILTKFELDFLSALKKDLKRSPFESLLSEVHMLHTEINGLIKNLKKWSKPQKVALPLTLQPASGWIHPQPKGEVLIISPWNYPLLLALAPWATALAAGNVAFIKPSEHTPHTSQLIFDILSDHFERELICVALGDASMGQQLLSQPWDHIFFTGSTRVGQLVLRAAAEHLTPVTLELGGKSPAFVDHTADLKTAARRIAWGKFFNAGQTCVSPDHVWVEKSVAAPLVEEIKKTILEFYGPNPQASNDYARIVHEGHFDRLQQMLSHGHILHGGGSDRSDLFIEPTLIGEIHKESPLLFEEIFGPILPIHTCSHIRDAMEVVRESPRPLAAYLFAQDKSLENYMIRHLHFGGGCLNDTMLQFGSPLLPFGGTGASGMGYYHGQYGFNTFSHFKPWVRKSTYFDVPLRYPPYTLKKHHWLQRLLK